ncbi:MAG: hypothetical protein V3V08_15170 [Nannocystaceae bacterium]
MAVPTSTDELALMVENLIRDYVAQAHAAAVAGATRGLEHHPHESSPSKTRRRGVGLRERTSATKRSASRTPQVLQEVATRLYEKVCASPGGSMSQFAAALGLGVHELQYPRDMLKHQKRVRTTGLGARTRYYPVS